MEQERVESNKYKEQKVLNIRGVQRDIRSLLVLWFSIWTGTELIATGALGVEPKLVQFSRPVTKRSLFTGEKKLRSTRIGCGV